MNLKTHIMAGFLALHLSTLAGVVHANETNSNHLINFDDVAWQETGLEGAQMAVLWGSDADNSTIYAFRIQPGVEIPPHTHRNDYWGVAVQGNWVHIDAAGHEDISAQGAYAHIRGGELHSDRCAGPEVCINLLDFDGARDIAFPE